VKLDLLLNVERNPVASPVICFGGGTIKSIHDVILVLHKSKIINTVYAQYTVLYLKSLFLKKYSIFEKITEITSQVLLLIHV